MPRQAPTPSQPPPNAKKRNLGESAQHNTKASLSSLIKSSRDIMRKDAGLNGDLDRLPQLSWILFLKCYDDLEIRREEDAKATRQKYKPIIPPPYRWRDWASNENEGATGEDLIKFVNDGLLPALRGLSGSDERLKVAEVFKETYSRMLSGYLLRDVVNLVDGIHFQSKDEIFTLAHLYESMLKEMRDAAGDSGEFYTPRPVVKLIVDRTKPRLGETVLDPAFGTGGFLVEAYEYLKPLAKNSKDQIKLQSETLYGVEKKPLPYLLGTMNLLLHGVENPNIRRDNALKNPLNEIGEKDRFDVIVTNPPFGGEEEAGIQLNFPESLRASETALLFMQFVMRSLKHGGRCGVVVPNGFMFGDGVSARIKEQLLRNFDLHTIIRLPNGVFTPYTSIPTNLLFFARSQPTTDIWFYEHSLLEGQKTYSKTRPMQFEEFAPLIEWWDARVESEHAWKVRVDDVLKYDENKNLLSVNLDIKNPNSNENLEHLPPLELAENIILKEKQIAELMNEVKSLMTAKLDFIHSIVHFSTCKRRFFSTFFWQKIVLRYHYCVAKSKKVHNVVEIA
ncbi:MAG: N-6 DNA methylase, partial [Chloroflexi bacterium]|nr:N-6 DNA methylase [Chloroflexota bacterium]